MCETANPSSHVIYFRTYILDFEDQTFFPNKFKYFKVIKSHQVKKIDYNLIFIF